MTAALPATAGDGKATPDSGAAPGTSLIEQGYVHARFGGIPILVGPQLAAELKALRVRQP
jgi:hypothetical protein